MAFKFTASTKLLTTLELYLIWPGVNFINIFTNQFFVQKFVQSQNVTRKKTFVQKTRAFIIDEIDGRCQFHQHYVRAFFIQFFCQSQNVTRKKLPKWHLYKKFAKLTRALENFSSILHAPFSTKVLCTVIFWLQFRFGTFWLKNISTKVACKIMMNWLL